MRYYFIIFYWYFFNKKRWKDFETAIKIREEIKRRVRQKKKVKYLKLLLKEYIRYVLVYNFKHWHD